jgi:hypothetical protein
VRIVVRKLPSCVEVRLVPRRITAIRPLLLVSLWLAMTFAALAAIFTRNGGFILLPIIAIPGKRLYRPLAATLNRITIKIDGNRMTVRQGPLPVHRPVTLATPDVCEIRARELTESIGGWFVTGSTLDWSLRVQTYGGGGPTLPLALPTREVAERAAANLNEALFGFRMPRTYRG